MPNGGELRITAADAEAQLESDEECTCVAITVTDTGRGMDERTLANACKPFFTTKGEQGTGLGLVIVEQIIARAGGFVRIESSVDRGTTVRMYVPRIAPHRAS